MNIGTLNIEIAANVARIKADMDEVKKTVGAAMEGVKEYVGLAKTAIVALGGVLSVNAFRNLIEGGIEAKARLYDLSLQAGISVEALSALGKVAKYSNTSLDEVASASNKLSKALYSSNEDSKGAASAMKALGLEFGTFKQLSPDQQMLAVAKSLNEFKDGAGKSAAAMLLFGKSGATLLPFLKELGEKTELVGKQTTESAKMAKQYEDNLKTLKTAGDQWKLAMVNTVLPPLKQFTDDIIAARKAYGGFLEAFFDYARIPDLGKGLSQAATATVAQYRQAQDEIDKLQARQAKGGVFADRMQYTDAARITSLKAEQALLDRRLLYLNERQRLEQGAGPGRGFLNPNDKPKGDLDGLVGDKADKKARDDYTPLIKSINEKIAADRAEFESVAKLTEGQKMQAKVFADIDGGFVKLTLDQKLYVDGLLQQLIAGDKQNLARQQEKKFFSDLHDQQGVALQDSYKAARAAEDEAKVMHDQVAQYSMTREQLAALTTARLRDAAAQLEIQARFNGTSEFSEAQAKDMKDRAAAMRYQADQRDMLAYKEDRARMDPFGGAERAVKSYLDNIRQAGLGTEAVVTRALGNMEDAFVSLATSGKFSFKDLANSIIADIVRIQVRAAITQASSGGGGLGGILSVIGNVVGGLFGGGGSNPDYGNEGRNYPPPEISGQRAAGGPVNAGRSYLVGERGPEILRMGGRSGTVIPNDRIGGAALNVNIINQAGAEVSTSRDSNGDLQVLIAKAAEQGAQRGYRLGVADLVSGTGPMSAALQQRGVSLGNGAVRRY